MPLKIKYQNIKLLQQQYPNLSFSRKFEQEIVDFDPIDDHRDARYRVLSYELQWAEQSEALRKATLLPSAKRETWPATLSK